MSVFLSFNYDTGLETAEVLETKLKSLGIDAWWFPHALNHHQIDSQISLALDNCTRCILIWTNEPMSGWQTAEISTIRHQFRDRVPGRVAEECFIIARAVDKVPPNGELPLFIGCEYLDFRTDDIDAIDLSFLDEIPPGLIPVTCGKGRKPRIKLPDNFKLERGHHVIHGDFVECPFTDEERYCWMFLWDGSENGNERYYIQQPRPTVTHKKRWAASNINVGENLRGVVLAAVNDDTHREIVSRVLQQNYGAIPATVFKGGLEVLDRIYMEPPKKQTTPS